MISDETIEKIIAFRDERNWKQFHTPKDLAISISLEAAELLEIYQWSGSDTVRAEKKDKVREELADILMYCFLMADVCDVEPEEIILEKLERNRQKYPAAEFYGSSRKYNELKDAKK